MTILFADVTGSTALGERLDPERLKETLGAFFTGMREEIEAEGGTVEKFIGDAVMAAFGVPIAHEDDPARALRAALGMRRRLEELNRGWESVGEPTLEIRIGINTGEVVAAIAPKPGEAMVSGDAVNVAARLEQSADIGRIVVAERTARATRGFRFRELGLLQLKGKAVPVPALELAGKLTDAERSVPGLHAPMVGRDRELALLQSLYRRMAQERSPHLVTIYGDAGVGKSRLVAEFIARAEAAYPVPLILRGRCLPYGDGVTYWPLAEILKSYAGVLDTDDPEVAVEKIRKSVRGLFTAEVSDDPERATSALAYTVGIEHPVNSFRDLPPRRVRSEIHAAWRAFFSALSREAPVVAVIEDIHWADRAMLDVLQESADRISGGVLVVCPSRPELMATRRDWGGGRRNFSSLFLEPLLEHDAGRLMSLLLSVEGLPRTVHERILERAEGNPLFLEEIIRQLIDGGQIARTGDRWRAVADIEDVVIPDNVQAILAARIDLLAAEDKRTVQLAAVVGRVFWPGPLRLLLNGESEQIEDAMERLQDRELILARLRSAMAGEREFIFKHVLTRDVAYESLPRRDRAKAHSTVGRWIEETAGERQLEFVELLAYHSLEAYRMLQDRAVAESDADHRVRAFEYLLAASADARSKLASSKAHRLGERALDIAANQVERSRALAAVGQAALDDYKGDEAWRCFAAAADARHAAGTDTADDRLALALLCARACDIPTRWPGSMSEMPDEQQVTHYLDMGLQLIPAGDSEATVCLLTAKAFMPWAFPATANNATEAAALEAGSAAADTALRLGRPDLASAALDGVDSVLMMQERFADAKTVTDRRRQLLDRINDPFEVGDVYALSAWVRFDLGLYAEAAESATEGRERAADAPAMVVHCQAWCALSWFRLGRWQDCAEGIAVLEQMLGDRRTDPPYFALRPFGAAAFVCEVRGERGTADRFLAVVERSIRDKRAGETMAVALASLVRSRRGEFDAAWRLSDLLLPKLRGHIPIVWETRCDLVADTGSWHRATETLGSAREAAERGQLVALPAFADRLEGRAALAGNDAESAIMPLTEARNRFQEIGARWERAYTELSLGEALFRVGKRKQGRLELHRALAVFDELHSVREAERARELLG